jgi:hypothetical protein
MFWLRLFSTASLVLVFVFFITQIWIPTFLGRKWFPLFRKNEVTLSSKITELHQQLHEEELKAEVSNLQDQLEATQPSPVPTNVPAGDAASQQSNKQS